MNRLDSDSTALSYPTNSYFDRGPTRRLIVLVPADADYSAMARRVWELAIANESRVQLLSLCRDAAQESTLRRQLVTMSALIQDGKVSAEARVEIGSNWVNAIKADLQDGDMIVCFAEQRAGLLHRPLSQILESNLTVPVYILSGLYDQRPSRPNWIFEAAAWAGSLSIMAVFFWLQTRIGMLPKDWGQTTLMILSVVAEAWLIWVWNGVFS